MSEIATTTTAGGSQSILAEIAVAVGAAAVIAAAGFLFKTNRDIGVMKEQIKQGIDAIVNVKQSVDVVDAKVNENTKLTLDTAHTVSSMAPIMTGHSETVARTSAKIDGLVEQVVALKYNVKYLRDTINEVRKSYGMKPINYPSFDPRTQALPSGPLSLPEEEVLRRAIANQPIKTALQRKTLKQQDGDEDEEDENDDTE